MKRRELGAFRINPIIALGALGLVAIVVVMFMLGKSPEEAARQYMNALSRGDIAQLTKLSYLPDPAAPLEEQWKDTFENHAKNYVFAWKMEGSEKLSDDQAAVRILIVEFRGPELHENDVANLPLVKRDGEWKVDLRSLTRTFFPGLPR